MAESPFAGHANVNEAFASLFKPLYPQPKFYRAPDFESPRPLYRATEAATKEYVEDQLQLVPFWKAATLTAKQLRQACDALGIPTRGFSEKKDFVDAIDERRGTSCAICFVDFEADELLRSTNCGHLFHTECIREAMVEKARHHATPTCPTCRVRIDAVGARKKEVKRQNAAIDEAVKRRRV